MPDSIRRHLRSKTGRAQSLIQQWKTPKNSSLLMVLVEGWEDTLVYDQFFNPLVSRLIDSGGCEDVLGLNACINKMAPKLKRIAIIDSDFRFFYGRNKKRSNVFFTDTHDMETLIMFSSHCFQKVINKLKCPSVKHKDIVDDLRLLSYMRWYNQDAKMRYTWSGLDIVNMSRSKILDYDYLMNIYIPTSGTRKTWLKRCFVRFKNKHARAQSEHLINGHDYVDRLCHYAKMKDHIQLSDDDVLLGIALECEVSWFRTTQLGQAIMAWERLNRIGILR